MSKIEKVCNAVADKISSELNLDQDRREVIAYGTFALIQILLSIILVTLFGWFFDVVIEALVISFSMSILRKYSGGVHASNPNTCIVLGTAVTIGMAVGVSSLSLLLLNFFWVIILGLFTFAISYYLIYRLAPVDTPSKPITKEEKRERMKKGSILVLTVYLVIILIFLILYLAILERKLLIYSACIYAGVSWQIFTLTKSGHYVLTKIDTFLNQILFISRGK